MQKGCTKKGVLQTNLNNKDVYISHMSILTSELQWYYYTMIWARLDKIVQTQSEVQYINKTLDYILSVFLPQVFYLCTKQSQSFQETCTMKVL